jgi:hypothetical protein
MHTLNFGAKVRGLAAALWLVGGCGDDVVTTVGTTSATTTAETSAGPTSGAVVTTGDAATTTGGNATVTASGPTDPTTGGASATVTTEPPLTTGPQTDTGATEDTGVESSSGGETGEGSTCVKAEDCFLVDDCCSCEPVGPGETPPKCDLPECLVTQCVPKGLGGAALRCEFGRCTFAKIACNPTQVVCKSLPPDCNPGEVPSVDVDAGCWTGQCAPAEACDWAPDCSYCAEDELICVTKLQKGSFSVCEPKPVDCGDADDIDCACGQQVCDATPPHTVCHDAVDDIACECPNC